jgi:acylpyruvate hydrolase
VLPSPGKIICVGLNYRSHIQETGRDFPAYPTLFSKYPEALVGANDCITLPATSSKMDWEIELAVVVGSPLRKADLATARRAIAGYTVANDVTARDWQYRSGQWMQGKTFEATCPFGPELVTADEVDDAKDLRLRCLVDGNEVQSGTTADLLFPPAELLSYVSVICTLQPGDVVLTGTTGGVGHARTPPEYLTDGQVLTTEIEGLGRCDNRCVAE